MTDKEPCHSADKIGLFALAGLVVAVLGLMVIGSIWGPPDHEINETLLGTIAAGLLLFSRDIVNAVRASWEEVTRGKTNEQLAASKPAEATAVPDDAKAAADQVAEAASAEADRITS